MCVLFVTAVLALVATGFAWGQCVPPTIQVQPIGQAVLPGATVTMSVAATGAVPLSYQWFQIPPPPGGSPPMPVGSNAASFTTPPVTATQAYFVQVTNACGSVPSMVAYVSLQFQPQSSPSVFRVANSASSYFSGTNGFGIAQGSLFVVYGSDMGPPGLVQSNAYPVPTNLAGTSIQISMNGASYAALMIYTSSNQLAAILPSNVPVGDGILNVAYNGVTSAYSAPIHVVKSAFGIFTVSSTGSGAGVIQAADNTLLTFAKPAHPGDTVILWGTGLGPVNGAEAIAPLPDNNFNPEVFAGNQQVKVNYAGRSGCCSGVDEIVFQLPQNVQGCFVPIAVRSGGMVSNFVSIPVAQAGKPCSDPVGPTPDQLTKASSTSGLSFGIIAVGPIPALQNRGLNFAGEIRDQLSALLGTRVSDEEIRAIAHAASSRHSRAGIALIKKYGPLLRARHIDPEQVTAMVSALNYQGAGASFQHYSGPSAFTSEFVGSLPPPGTCVAGQQFSPRNPAALDRPVDAGTQLSLSGPAGNFAMPRSRNGQYQLPLRRGGANATVLPAGTYTVTSSGGRDVGAFTASLTVDVPLRWSNRDSVGFIDRSQPLTVSWTGGPPNGYVVFGGASSGNGPQSAFLCVEDVRKQSLTVPDFVLGAMPHTSNASVFLTLHPLMSPFNAPGIDFGYFANLSSDSKQIGLQ